MVLRQYIIKICKPWKCSVRLPLGVLYYCINLFFINSVQDNKDEYDITQSMNMKTKLKDVNIYTGHQ